MQGWELEWGYPSAVLPRHMEFPPQAAAQPQPRQPRQCRLPKNTPSPSEQIPPAQADCWMLGEVGHTEAVGGWGLLTLTATWLSHHSIRTRGTGSDPAPLSASSRLGVLGQVSVLLRAIGATGLRAFLLRSVTYQAAEEADTVLAVMTPKCVPHSLSAEYQPLPCPGHLQRSRALHP